MEGRYKSEEVQMHWFKVMFSPDHPGGIQFSFTFPVVLPQ